MTGEEIKKQVYDAVACDDMFYRPELRDAIYDMVDENAKLRESVRNLLICIKHEECEESCPNYEPMYTDNGWSTVVESEYLGCCTVGLENCNSMFFDTDEYLRELGIEANDV